MKLNFLSTGQKLRGRIWRNKKTMGLNYWRRKCGYLYGR